MTIKIICEDYSRKQDYLEYIVNNFMLVEDLPMKVVLSPEQEHGENVEKKIMLPLEGANPDLSPGTREETNHGIEENNIIKSGDLKIDVDGHRVWVDGEERFMTPKEFSVLLFLAKRPNRVCTRKEILESIWHSGHSTKEDTLTVHVNKIREKLEVDTKKPRWIETVWSVGYRFNSLS